MILYSINCWTKHWRTTRFTNCDGGSTMRRPVRVLLYPIAFQQSMPIFATRSRTGETQESCQPARRPVRQDFSVWFECRLRTGFVWQTQSCRQKQPKHVYLAQEGSRGVVQTSLIANVKQSYFLFVLSMPSSLAEAG